eukprot:CAMPEP_0198524372 /NCGR_PEP_ID=MMETSP1462-20131121/22707_1 /TAXON_ID=1333877 /ORGANISM="Brandtodinium nutriculum, Strain RCC3387" /LENGTH=92 /DNA_ID=CAMNT_0044254099 /DNA_START=75 /DNA_END=353 /DNA_ORIENTATION=-
MATTPTSSLNTFAVSRSGASGDRTHDFTISSTADAWSRKIGPRFPVSARHPLREAKAFSTKCNSQMSSGVEHPTLASTASMALPHEDAGLRA